MENVKKKGMALNRVLSRVNARINTLDEKQIQMVHDMSCTILEKAGIRVDDPGARMVFKNAAGLSVTDERVFIPREVTEWAIRKAPWKIEVLKQNGLPGFTLDSTDTEQSIFGVGSTTLHYQDPVSDKVSDFTRENMAQATRLANGLDEIETIATPGVVQDCKPEDSDLIGFLEMLANTDKPITLLVSDPKTFERCLTMCDLVVGEKATKTSVIPYFNPITPLILNSETTIKMELTVSRGMPLIFSNYGMSGATCPITPGGTLALLMAELLAGLVFAQLLKEGTPVILGSLPTAFDMKGMFSFYTPQNMLINLACADMMTHYRIPHCGTSGGWMGRGPDLMSGAMLWQNHLTSIMGSAGLVPFVGNNFDSMVFSPATLVYADEIIRMSRDFTKGFSLKPDEIGLDEIIRLGPGASYLTSNLTMKKYKEPLTKSNIWSFMSLDQWHEKGSPRAGKELREHTQNLINTLTYPESHDQIIETGNKYLGSLST